MSDHGSPRTPAPESRPAAPAREPLWRDLVGEALRRERLAQRRTLKEVAEAARISMPYLSEIERGRKEASSEVLAAAARALGLSLGDLLVRVYSDFATRTGATARPAAASRAGAVRTAVVSRTSTAAVTRAGARSVPHRGGLCLAA